MTSILTVSKMTDKNRFLRFIFGLLVDTDLASGVPVCEHAGVYLNNMDESPCSATGAQV
jgi:hypothetical protein